jgi:hypothetical protein
LTKDRLEDAIRVPDSLNIRYTCVSNFDSDQLQADIHTVQAREYWNTRIDRIKNILLQNASSSDASSARLHSSIYSQYNPNSDMYPDWLGCRGLSLGEISVLLKHYWSIAAIANGEDNYGMIIEDDARHHELSCRTFYPAFREFVSLDGDYLDIAGGCGLHPVDSDLEYKYITRLAVPRTRTNAAYILSRKLAKRFSSHFLPLVYPIDWHLQYLFDPKDRCFWSKTPIFLHGSEEGLLESWRK